MSWVEVGKDTFVAVNPQGEHLLVLVVRNGRALFAEVDPKELLRILTNDVRVFYNYDGELGIFEHDTWMMKTVLKALAKQVADVIESNDKIIMERAKDKTYAEYRLPRATRKMDIMHRWSAKILETLQALIRLVEEYEEEVKREREQEG